MKLSRAAAVAVIAAAPLFASAGLVSVFFEKAWDPINGDVNGSMFAGYNAHTNTISSAQQPMRQDQSGLICDRPA